jgi:acetyl-CoA carboxylase biotin carboxylase subunit
MRVVQDASFLRDAILAATHEAKTAFGNGDVYLERYLKAPRHIEVQVLGDQHGNVVSFPERDCSVQRRHQKLIEESPSPMVSDSLRKKMGKADRRAGRFLASLRTTGAAGVLAGARRRAILLRQRPFRA